MQYDSDRFGAFSESLARNLGTAQFLVWQTVVIVVWIVHNAFAPDQYQFDPWSRGLVLLTLVLSLQASYAAPLILLAQNRQEFRDRLTAESDRHVAERTQADTEFLAREIASVRLSLSDMVTGETLDERLDDRLERLTTVIEQLSDQVAMLSGAVGERGRAFDHVRSPVRPSTTRTDAAAPTAPRWSAASSRISALERRGERPLLARPNESVLRRDQAAGRNAEAATPTSGRRSCSAPDRLR